MKDKNALIPVKPLDQYTLLSKEWLYSTLIETINTAYTKYRTCTPIYSNFLYHQHSVTKIVCYTPTSVLTQYFQEHFQTVYFLCGHYAVTTLDYEWDATRRRKKENGPKLIFEDETNTEVGIREVGAFVLTFFKKPNIIWEETLIPMVYDNKFIQCKFECISHFNILKKSIDEIFVKKIIDQLQNETLIDFLCRKEWVSNVNGRIKSIQNPNILRFFIPFEDIRQSIRICPVKLMSLSHIYNFANYHYCKNKTNKNPRKEETQATKHLFTEPSNQVDYEREVQEKGDICKPNDFVNEYKLICECDTLEKKRGNIINDYLSNLKIKNKSIIKSRNEMKTKRNKFTTSQKTVKNVWHKLLKLKLCSIPYDRLTEEIDVTEYRKKNNRFKDTLRNPWQLPKISR